MKKEKVLILLMVIFLLIDLTYSFFEYYFTPLDGDISAGVIPISDVQRILDDPFGFKVLALGENHINPNRFFAHYLQVKYLQNVPIGLQELTNPITSVYLSCALLKIFVHLLFLLILSIAVSGIKNISNKQFLIAGVLLAPLIQANGYWGHMGINDRATTYVFFYALPLVLLMAFLLPVYRTIYYHEDSKPGLFQSLLILIGAIILPLSGPLVPAVVIIITGLIGLYYLQKFHEETNSTYIKTLIYTFKKIPFRIYISLIPISIVSLYSIILGRFDTNSAELSIPVIERYQKLPIGIYYQISQSLGVPLLLLIISLNAYLINKYFKTQEAKSIIKSLKWIGIFATIYLLLLPMGGYRTYRPNILRYDTFMPITIALLYFYCKSSYFLLLNMAGKKRMYFTSFLFVLFAIYMNSDILETGKYSAERKCLEILANSDSKITRLPSNCNVMSWEPITDPRLSENNATMFKFWRITKEKKLYYQTSEQN